MVVSLCVCCCIDVTASIILSRWHITDMISATVARKVFSQAGEPTGLHRFQRWGPRHSKPSERLND